MGIRPIWYISKLLLMMAALSIGGQRGKAMAGTLGAACEVEAMVQSVIPEAALREQPVIPEAEVGSNTAFFEAEGSGQTALHEVEGRLEKIGKYCSTRIAYQFGNQTEILDGNTVLSWVLYDRETDTLSLDREQMAGYIASLAEKYDTYLKPRVFQTSMGDTVTVDGGSYGWLLDQERELELLEHYIRSGANRSHVPKFAHTAADWSHSDLGDTYVEVDLTNQHVWLYVDGVQEVSADCVSGTYTNSGRRTPEGTYTIYFKESPSVLRGADWNSPVSYWMPFNGGIGLHDASWRSDFGGNIFQSNGSHGCINLPLRAAETIYGYAYTGMPVICYYRD